MSSKAEVQEKVTKMKVIRQKVIEGMGDSLNQRYLYTMPYNEFYLTSPEEDGQVGFSKKDIFVAVKQLQDSQGRIKRLFELYDEELNKFAETDEDGRLKYDKELTDELIKMKQLLARKNEEQGTNFEIAGLDESGELEAYMQMINSDIVSLTASQKRKVDSKTQKKDSHTQVLENKKDEETMEASQQKEQQMQDIASDLQMDPQDIYQMTQIKDDTFLRSEGINNGTELCAIKTRSGALQIVSKGSDGKFEKSKAFGEGTSETGRTTYTTNDHNNLSETNTYGAIPFANNPNMRIAARMGQYGELELIRQERVTSNPDGRTMSNEEAWSPGVLIQSDNTARGDMDLDGEYSQSKIVHNKIDRDNIRMNEESNTIRTHGGENLKVQDIGNDSVRGESAFEKVKAELAERGVEMSTQDSEALKKKFKDRGTTFCPEEVDEFCDKYEEYIKQKENQQSKDGEEEEHNGKIQGSWYI